MKIQVFCHVTLGHQAIQRDWLSLITKAYHSPSVTASDPGRLESSKTLL